MPNRSSFHQVVGCLVLTFLPFFVAAQADTIAPQLVCKPFQEANMSQLCYLYFNQNDLLASYTDNNTPAAQLEFGLRLRCTGSGFPENQALVSLGVTDMYLNSPIEVWARDQAGNTAVCESTIYLVENGVYCKFSVSASAKFAGNSQPLSGVLIDITATRCPEEYWHIEGVTSQNFGLIAAIGVPSGFQGQATATKNTHPLNGITIHDLYLISQHIQGITLLTNPWQLIAADADQDGQITKNDLLTLRRLMSGLISELPNGRSWRFVPAVFVFDPLQPLVFPETITALQGQNHFDFTGVKIGDVDFSADRGL